MARLKLKQLKAIILERCCIVGLEHFRKETLPEGTMYKLRVVKMSTIKNRSLLWLKVASPCVRLRLRMRSRLRIRLRLRSRLRFHCLHVCVLHAFNFALYKTDRIT